MVYYHIASIDVCPAGSRCLIWPEILPYPFRSPVTAGPRSEIVPDSEHIPLSPGP